MIGDAGRKYLCGVAVSGAVVFLLSACTTATDKDEPKLPEKNQAQWVLPLDKYSFQTVDLPTTAAQLLVQPCLRDKGWPWRASAVEAKAKPGESWNSAHQKLFSVDLAEKYGYGNSPELDLPVSTLQELDDIFKANSSLDPAAEKDVNRCFAEADRALGNEESSQPWDLASALARQAYDKSLVAQPVVRATSAWRKCMAHVGVSDLPNSPDLMPSPSISALGPAADAPWTPGVIVVDPEERRVAVADAGCQDTSGYATVAYEAEWNEEAKLLRANADAIERYDKQMQKINRRAEKVIADYTPSSSS